MRERGILVALLAGMGAISYHSTSNGEAKGPSTRSVEIAPVEPASGESDLAKTLERFDKRRSFRISFGADGQCRLEARSPKQGPTKGGFDWTLAIVPDPIRSNLTLDFDREIEFLQLAAGKAGYQFERYWLPWSLSPSGTKEGGYVIEPAGLRVKAPQDHRSSLPGVLLFRNSRSTPLAIFLVSETPTGGIEPEEFRSALALGRALSALDGKKHDGIVHIIGPGMSGSLETLASLINNHSPGVAGVFVRAWTLDHFSHEQFRKSLRDGGGDKDKKPELDHTPADFRPVDIESLPAINAFADYIQNRWHDDSPIFLLTEEDTAFGNPREDTALGNPQEAQRSTHRIIKIPFPRNLSKLRNAAEDHDHTPGSGDLSRRSDIPRNGILFSLRQEVNGGSLELPTFSKEQTPVSQESAVFTIGNMLKTGIVHYVGIFATDPLDSLFLMRYLRRNCPNARIFTLTPDLLLEHGSDASDYSGILSIASSPLFPLSQLWSRPGPNANKSGIRERVAVFPSQTAEAVYNATLEVLHDLPGSKLHCELERRDVGNPFSDKPAPPLWITIAGGSGFEPIDVIDPQGSPQDQWHAPPYKFVPEYWPGWTYAYLAISTLCFVFCALMLFARLDGMRAFAFFSPQLDSENTDDDYHPVPKAFYLFALGASLSTLIAIWLVVPGVIVRMNLDSESYRLEMTGSALFVAGIMVVAALRDQYGTAEIAGNALSREQTTSVLPARSAAALSMSGSLTTTLALVLKSPFSPERSSTVLTHLYWSFCLGAFCLGATTLASTIPLWNIMRIKFGKGSTVRGLICRAVQVPYFWGVCVTAAILVTVLRCALVTMSQHRAAGFLAAYRALDLTNGVSPLVPATFLVLALTILAFVQLRRMAYYEDRCPAVPDVIGNVSPSLKIEHIMRLIRTVTMHLPHWILLAFFVIALALVFTGSSQTVEQPAMEELLVCGVLIVGTFTLLVWIRLMLIWFAFSEFLQQLERHPIRQVFSLLPRGFIWSPVWQGGGKKRIHVAIVRSLECMQALVHHRLTPEPIREQLCLELNASLPGSLASRTKDLLDAAASYRRFPRPRYRELENSLRDVAEMAVQYLNRTTWRRGDYELKSELASKEETKDALHQSRDEYVIDEPATICSELVAYRFLAFINFVLWHIDNLVSYTSLGFLLLLIALNSYAFRSRTIIDWTMTALFLLLTAGIVWMFAEADRDAILSRITGTEEGKLDRHFFTHLISYGGIPAVVLLATHFPTVGRFFFSWVKPALEAIH